VRLCGTRRQRLSRNGQGEHRRPAEETTAANGYGRGDAKRLSRSKRFGLDGPAMTLGTPLARFALSAITNQRPGLKRVHGLRGVTGSVAYDGVVGKTATAAWRGDGRRIGVNRHVCELVHLVVSTARQASLILEEVHSVRMIVGASLRAGRPSCC
jgi:hypothetical protein